MEYKDYRIKADVMSPKYKVRKDGLKIFLYGWTNYSYDSFFIFNFNKGSIHSIDDFESAKIYFKGMDENSNIKCAKGRPGFGVEIF